MLFRSDGFLTIVALHVQAGGQHADDGHKRKGDDGDADRDLDHREGALGGAAAQR